MARHGLILSQDEATAYTDLLEAFLAYFLSHIGSTFNYKNTKIIKSYKKTHTHTRN